MTPQDFFKNDLFAERAGIVLMEVREGYSKARLEIKKEHLNAGNRTQGGAIFTLADLALAAAANSHGQLAFSLSSNITFLRASGIGDTLYAEARERYIGRSTGYYQIDITNQKNELIATLNQAYSAKINKYLLLCDNRSKRITIPGNTSEKSFGRPDIQKHIQTNREVVFIICNIECNHLLFFIFVGIFHK